MTTEPAIAWERDTTTISGYRSGDGRLACKLLYPSFLPQIIIRQVVVATPEIKYIT